MRTGPSERAKRRFAAWYEADPSHRAAYDDQAKYWDASPELSPRFPIAEDAVGPERRAIGRQASALAAVVLACIGLGTFMLVSDATRPPVPVAQEMLLIATTVGEMREVPLGGGSQLVLDTDSAVRRGVGNQPMELQRGRARVHAALNAGPLLLKAGPARIEAEGAVFDVRVEGESAIITPVRGQVTVRTDGTGHTEATRLSETQSLAVTRNGNVRLRRGADRSTQWPSGMLEFDRARLADVVAEANRYSRQKLRLADPGLAELRVTGAFRAGDIQGLARSLGQAFDLELTESPEGDLVLRAASG